MLSRLSLRRRDQDTDANKKDHVKTREEDGHLQAAREDSEETNPFNTLIWASQCPELAAKGHVLPAPFVTGRADRTV